ncbi:MAG: multidrug ABC transporter permease [Thermoprotei archaeon]|nr:MAG: multidrug ABC transporter permease [Thermoprotei archaeon]
MSENFKAAKKLLVLCVDRDDDIGQVTRLKTPIVGRDNVLKAAIDFAIKVPDDSDANALFAAVQTYDNLVSTFGRQRCEIAVVAGLPQEGIEADIKILSELTKVLEKFKADGVVLISDGPTDEQVIPIIQSKLPVLSVKRIVVRQSRGVEESFVLLTKYAKKLVEEPKYKKYSLGIPGIFMVVYVILSLTGLLEYISSTLMLILGVLLFMKGFNIPERIKTSYSNYPISFTLAILSSIVLFLTSIYVLAQLGLNELSASALISFLTYTFGSYVMMLDVVVLSGLVISAGYSIEQIIRKTRQVPSVLSLVLLFPVLRQVILEACYFSMGRGSMLLVLYWFSMSCLVVVLSYILVKKIEKILYPK